MAALEVAPAPVIAALADDPAPVLTAAQRATPLSPPVCPFLGFRDDPSTRCDYPDPRNQCHATSSASRRQFLPGQAGAKRSREIDASHQQSRCLTFSPRSVRPLPGSQGLVDERVVTRNPETRDRLLGRTRTCPPSLVARPSPERSAGDRRRRCRRFQWSGLGSPCRHAWACRSGGRGVRGASTVRVLANWQVPQRTCWPSRVALPQSGRHAPIGGGHPGHGSPGTRGAGRSRCCPARRPAHLPRFRGRGHQPDPDHRGDQVRIASITKPLVAALVLGAVARGELGLDEEVGSLLPGVLRSEPAVTVRQLLDHRQRHLRREQWSSRRRRRSRPTSQSWPTRHCARRRANPSW